MIRMSGAYSSAASASDLEDLRRALGYEAWNLYGISYGTRLALTAMRDHPEGLRSVILDSTYPPQVDLYATMAVNGERALELVFESCAAEPGCNQAYPDLRDRFYALVERLDQQPVMFTVTRPLTGESYAYVLNGDRLIVQFYTMLYRTELIPRLPRLIDDLSNGDWDALQGLLLMSLFGTWSEGMHYAVQCNEEAPFGSPASVEAANSAASPRFSTAMNSAVIYKICHDWQTDKTAAVENEPVKSDVPALILSGEFDPITPPGWAHLAAETLENAQVYVFPGTGHSVLHEAICPYLVATSFLYDPHSPVDASCLDRLDFAFEIQ